VRDDGGFLRTLNIAVSFSDQLRLASQPTFWQ